MSLPRPDFLHPTRGAHGLAWAALAASLLVLGVAGVDAWQARSDRIGAQARVALLSRPAVRVAPAPETAAQRTLRLALSQTDRPWGEVFASVEAMPVDRIAWLALDVGEGGRLRLEGEAPDAAAALAAAQALRADPLWREVVVTRLDAAPGGGRRFALAAQPAPGAW